MPKSERKKIASFNTTEAFKQLSLTELLLWNIEYKPIAPSPFFQERWARLQCFDLQKYEESKFKFCVGAGLTITVSYLTKDVTKPAQTECSWKSSARRQK
ncbi:hypothetical protein [Coleofasciculus sp. G2-EDA-02]|uniref:hypothetical protein n=1 Tax=Coleofasciculus sp. G2-EDA-02 TaxID=3069529 RepID=UPI003303B817